MCRWDVWWWDDDQMCEYDTLDSDVYDGTNFWTVRSYYFWILPLNEFDWCIDDFIDIDY